MKDPRLLVPLADLPGFDASGLVLMRTTEPRLQSCIYDKGSELLEDRSFGKVLLVGVDRPTARWEVRAHQELIFDFSSTRDRAARWLATHKRIASSDSLDSACAPSFEPWGDRAWAIFKLSIGYVGDRYFGPSPLEGYGIDGGMVVPGLADLDHTEVSRIDDGAYLRDVLALAVICRHVGSLS